MNDQALGLFPFCADGKRNTTNTCIISSEHLWTHNFLVENCELLMCMCLAGDEWNCVYICLIVSDKSHNIRDFFFAFRSIEAFDIECQIYDV